MPGRKFSDANYERMCELRELGWAEQRIADEIGCSIGLVRWTCLRLGADHPRAKPLPDCIVGPAVMKRGDHVVRRFTPEDDAELLRLTNEEKLKRAEIARRLGRKPNSVQGRLLTLARREARRELAT